MERSYRHAVLCAECDPDLCADAESRTFSGFSHSFSYCCGPYFHGGTVGDAKRTATRKTQAKGAREMSAEAMDLGDRGGVRGDAYPVEAVVTFDDQPKVGA